MKILKKIEPIIIGLCSSAIIGVLAFLSFETSTGFWLMISFGATSLIVFVLHDKEFAQPGNIFFGHLLTTFVGIVFITFFEVSFITIGLAVGIAVMLMIALKVTHPPAGGNPIAVMLGGVSFQFLVFPVMVGAIAIIIGGIIYNSLILKRKYPISWK